MGQICAEATDVRTCLGFGNEGTSLTIRTLSRTSDDSEFAILEDLNSSDSNLSRMTQHLWTLLKSATVRRATVATFSTAFKGCLNWSIGREHGSFRSMSKHDGCPSNAAPICLMQACWNRYHGLPLNLRRGAAREVTGPVGWLKSIRVTWT